LTLALTATLAAASARHRDGHPAATAGDLHATAAATPAA